MSTDSAAPSTARREATSMTGHDRSELAYDPNASLDAIRSELDSRARVWVDRELREELARQKTGRWSWVEAP